MKLETVGTNLLLLELNFIAHHAYGLEFICIAELHSALYLLCEDEKLMFISLLFGLVDLKFY